MDYICKGLIDLSIDQVKLMLVTSDYTPDPTHDVLADVQASPDPEVVAIASPDNGYIAGGKALTNQSVVLSDSPAAETFDANDVTWTALTATFRYGILYVNKTISSPAIVNPLLGCITFDTAPADIVINGVDYTVQWNISGIFTLTKL
jgi:hypothetical protein